MSKIIYVKYSNERSRELSIVTKIMMDESGKKYLLKIPAFPEAKRHVKNIEKNYRSLCENYKDSDKIEINNCTLNEDGSVRLEFINGETLEQRVDNLVFSGCLKEAVDEIREYFEELKKYNSGQLFKKTDEFVRVFGDVDGFENSYSGKINDIDRVLGNVIIEDNKYKFVDYEWTFNFPIPLEYILFRIVHYYVNTEHERNVLINEGIYDLIGISDEQIEACLLMEKNFQKYVEGDVVSLGMLHDNMVKKCYHLEEALFSLKQQKIKTQIRLYFDDGKGFLEEKSKIFTATQTDSDFLSKVVFEKEFEKIRIDITEERVVIKISSMTINNEDIMKSGYVKANGYVLEDGTWAFLDGDPNFVIDRKIRMGDILEIKYNIERISDSQIAVIMKNSYLTKDHYYNLIVNELTGKNNELDRITNELISKNNELASRTKELENVNNRMNELLNSFSWKITKPLRKIGSLLKN